MNWQPSKISRVAEKIVREIAPAQQGELTPWVRDIISARQDALSVSRSKIYQNIREKMKKRSALSDEELTKQSQFIQTLATSEKTSLQAFHALKIRSNQKTAEKIMKEVMKLEWIY